MTNAPHAGGLRDSVPRPEDYGFGRLFDEVGDAVVLADERGRIVLWNAAASRLLGYDPHDAVGLEIGALVPPELRPAHLAGMTSYRRTGEGKLLDRGKPYEVPALRKDGSRVFVDITLTRYQHEGQAYLLAVIRDVDERVNARREEDRHRKQLQDAIDSLEAFAHVIAHDLKEPVRGMSTFLDDLEADPDAADRADKIRRAAQANRNLRHLIEGLLEWSRTTMTPLEPRELNLHAVLTDDGCQAQWSTLAAERGATIEISRELPAILGTEALVCRVFGNLVTNAIRHNPAPDPRVVIRPGAPPRRGMIEILIEDNGPGFPERVIQRAHALPNKPTTIKGGFGLAIARRAADRLRGTIVLTNAPGGGGVARILLPAPAPVTPIEERVRELV